MSAHRRKRLFAGAATDPSQRQITSYFSPADASSATSASSAWPQIPDNVAANLMSVGMRVRKSVPEGYRNVDTGVFKLWTESNSPGQAQTHRATQPVHELLPFCGLNKVGGLHVQPQADFDGEDDDIPSMNAIPGLTLSQESVQSTDSEPQQPKPQSRKRLFTPNDDSAALVPTLWVPKAFDGEISPHTLAPGSWPNARVIATPHSHLQKSTALADMGQENMLIDHDFDEADFLVYGNGRDVEMTP
ncbi:hypothetical protein CDD81_684 [Ophiocordyceps australis]|uniref:Uncharacterized protein n=1 Tax=Ophiocordyceps australis TaxID=1399860 RepID=A0A2C5Y0M2_9HYPO|nr:hypothetical protein CDD81_684 [Ophiocordyceps australis]